MLRTNYPTLDEATLRQALTGAKWSEEQIAEGLAIFTAPTPASIPTPPLEVETSSPQPFATQESKKNMRRIMLIGGVIFLLSAVSALGYYVVTETSLFRPKPALLTNENLLPNIMAKLGEISTVEYDLEAKLEVVPREPNATPFAIAVPPTPEVLLQYQRDQDRMRDIAEILRVIQKETTYHTKTPTPSSPSVVHYEYPADVSLFGVKMSDGLGVPYVYTASADKQTYTLAVTFETQEAVDSVLQQEPVEGVSKGFDGNASRLRLKESLNGKTVTISNGSYFSAYGFTGKPAQPKLFGLFDVAQLETVIPADLSGAFSFGGTLDTTKERPIDGRAHIGGILSFGDANFAFDAEGIKKGAKYFGIVNKLPSFFSAMGALRGKWISLTEEDLKNYGYASFYESLVPSEESERKAKLEKVRAQWKTLLQIASQEGVVVISGTPEKIQAGEEEFTQYRLALVKEKILPFYEHATEALASYEKESILPRDKKTIEYLKGENFSLIAEYVKNSTTFTLLMDEKGFPAKVELLSRYVPSPDARFLKEKQINFTLTSTLKDINETPLIEEPKESITFDDLMAELTGKSKEELRLEQQAANVAKLKGAINQYYEWTGAYPETLADLKKLHKDVPHTPASTTNATYSSGFSMDEYYKELPFLKNIPIDLYTKQQFPYRSYMSGAPMYDFTYMMEIPPYKGTVNPSVYAFAEAVGEYGSANGKMLSREENKKRGMTFTPRFVNGKNTATKSRYDISSEAETYSMFDQDVDGLPDMLEEYFGTDVAKKDTDDDGFSDAEELIKGSNPLGPGNLDFKNNNNLFMGM